MSFVIIILSSFFFKNCLLLLVLPCVPLPEFYLQAPVPINNVGIQNWYGIAGLACSIIYDFTFPLKSDLQGELVILSQWLMY